MTTTIDARRKKIADYNIERAFDLAQDIIANPERAKDIPRGVFLVNVPDDDPEIAEANLEGAIRAFKAGKNVFLRHAAAKHASPEAEPAP